MNDCNVALETLALYREGALPAAEQARVAGHVEGGCARCRENLAWLGETVKALRAAGDFVRPPESAVRKARRLFRERRPSPSLREVLARLVFDGRGAALAGARDSGADGFQRLYSTDGFDIDLWGEPAEEAGTYYLIGQVRSRADGAAVEPDAVLLNPAAPGREPLFALPQSGEFYVAALPAGVYDVRLQMGEEGIVLPGVVVGE